MRGHRRHPRATLAVVAVCGLAVVLVGIELLMATLLAHPGWVSASPLLLGVLRDVYAREDWAVIQGDASRIVYDAELLYLLRPGPTRFSNREFETTLDVNSEGLRDDEASLDGPDIIVLGDSYALGWGVEQGESFPRHLERLSGLKVLNASMASYGTGRQTLLLERLDTSRTRAVVLQYFHNDFAENRAFAASASPPAAMREADFRRWLRRLERQQRYRPLDYLRAALSRESFHPELDGASPEEVARACLDVLLASDEIVELPVFFLQIDPWAVPDRSIVPALAELLGSEHAYASLGDRLTIVDLAGALSPGDFFLLDPHLRPTGHQKVAARIERALRDAGLLRNAGVGKPE